MGFGALFVASLLPVIKVFIMCSVGAVTSSMVSPIPLRCHETWEQGPRDAGATHPHAGSPLSGASAVCVRPACRAC